MIDAEKFRPKKRGESDKFSWNIYRFLKRHPGVRVMYYFNPVEYIRSFDPNKSLNSMQTFLLHPGPGMSGVRVHGLMMRQSKFGEIQQASYCLWDKERFTDITDWFFKTYERIGCCIFDREHSGWWRGEGNRFTYINKHSRRCNWCGEWHERHFEKRVDIVRIERWIANAPKNQIP